MPAKISVDAGALTRPSFAVLPPLALYVHIPWCLKKCPYCDFNSHEAQGDPPEGQYVDALLADLEFALPSIWGRKVVSVFMGGGTPSLFSDAAIDRLLGGIRARVPLLPGAEVTLEANPGTFERQKFAGYFAAGVNRLSLGIQSFDPAHLKALGRVHDADEARRAAEAALMIFGNVNFDLMYGLPRQTLQEARATGKVTTLFGRVRYIPEIHNKSFTVRGNAERMATNAPIQGTAADILKLAMISLDERLGDDARMLLTVHDEIVIEVAEGKAEKVAGIVKETMENIYPLAVPLAVDTHWGRSWYDAKE